MLTIGPIAFAAPWLLLALPALPVRWWLLRVTPPAPRRIAFPSIRLLRDLPLTEETPARTPWWLLLLRLVAAALVIIGLARPVLGPGASATGEGTLLLVIDDGWPAGVGGRSVPTSPMKNFGGNARTGNPDDNRDREDERKQRARDQHRNRRHTSNRPESRMPK